MPTDFDSHKWDPDAALASLTDEVDALDSGDETKTTERILRQALPAATAAVVNAALYSTNERIRLEAAKLIMDRCLGTVAQSNPLGAVKDPLAQLVEEIYEHNRKEAV